jgi:8-oxo-dGTP pyrophosphatase MutT (NUDIX family)
MSPQDGTRYVGPYTVLHSKPIYENPWIKVREDRVERLGGEESTFGVVTMKPGVSVLPMDEAGEVYLAREFKYGVGDSTLEAISGAIESGENPEQAGLRELGEEAGLVAAEWVDMGMINPFTTVVNSPNHMFLVRDLSERSRGLDAGEHIEIVKMPFDDALQAVLDGTITHGASCVLILKTQIYLSRKQRR